MSSTVSLLPGVEAHCSGALWLPRSKTLLIADLHLGYGWAQRRRGELGPLADERTRERLTRTVEEFAPQCILFLGDLVHAPRAGQAEREWIEHVLRELSTRTEVTAVRGNHDRAFAREFAHLRIRSVESWQDENILAVHGDRLPTQDVDGRLLVMGHLHPSLPVRDAAGAAQRMPVFLMAERCLVLPAFSPFARGFDLAQGLPPELLARFGTEFEVYAATPTRVVRLGPVSRILQRSQLHRRGLAYLKTTLADGQ